jgi:histidinol-phosphate aminotransferase
MSLSRRELIKKEIFDIAEYVPGKSIEEIASAYGLKPESIIKLGSNENPLGPSPKAVRALIEAAPGANIYPSADAGELREALSKYTGFPVSNIVASGPGMDGLLDGLCRIIIEKGDEVIIPTPTFSYYELPAKACGGKPVFIRRNPDFSVDPEKVLEAVSARTKIIFLCSPNNPSGNLLPEADLRKIVENTRSLVFVDEAYVEFADRNLSALVKEYDNLVIGRTFSKVFGLAGLRLGYGIMPEWLAKEYLRAATPFSVSLPALRAGLAALSDTDRSVVAPDSRGVSRAPRYSGLGWVLSRFRRRGFHPLWPGVPSCLAIAIVPCRRPTTPAGLSRCRFGVFRSFRLGSIHRVISGKNQTNRILLAI